MHDSAVSPCFHGCLAFLHRHFPPQSPPSRPFNLSLHSQQQPPPWDCSTIPKLQLQLLCLPGACVPVWGMYVCGKDCLILIPFRLPQISCFILSLKCFSSDWDSGPNVGITPLLQFPHWPREGPVLLTLLFVLLVPLSYWVLCSSIYSFLVVRYSRPLSVGILHTPLCLKVCSWCVHGERCIACPPTLPPSCSPPFQFSSIQSLSRVRLFVTPWIAARQASLSITNSWSSLKLMSIESVMPSSHLILCCPLLLLPPIPPSIRVFSNESTLRMRWSKYWSFSFSLIPFKEHPVLISFRMDWLDLLAVQGTLKSLLQHHTSKASVLRHSAVFRVQLSHPYLTTGKTIA